MTVYNKIHWIGSKRCKIHWSIQNDVYLYITCFSWWTFVHQEKHVMDFNWVKISNEWVEFRGGYGNTIELLKCVFQMKWSRMILGVSPHVFVENQKDCQSLPRFQPIKKWVSGTPWEHRQAMKKGKDLTAVRQLQHLKRQATKPSVPGAQCQKSRKSRKWR